MILRIAEKLKALKHLDESERYMIAGSLAATPDERWQMSQEFLRSLGLSRLSERKKIRFQVAGMTAAILQGVPATTIDADLWIDLPQRQYMRVLNICRALGARVIANTVVALANDSLVNFRYRVDGLAAFATGLRRAVKLEWLGHTVSVLPLESIIRSKEFAGRPKDLAHLPLLRDVHTCATQLHRPKRNPSPNDARRKAAS